MDFKTYLRAHYSPSAQKNYLSCIERYQASTPNEKTAGLREVLSYMGYLRATGKAPRSIINELCAIKTYYRYLQQTGQRADHPCAGLKYQGKVSWTLILDTLYTPKQMEDFLESHQSGLPLLQSRDDVLISLLVYQGLSVTEVVHLEIQQVNLDKGTLYIKGSPRTNPRELALKPCQIMAINQYITICRPKLLTYAHRKDTQILLLSHLGRAMNPETVNWTINRGKTTILSPQKIRQSVIYQKLKEGHDLRIVQAFAGHKYISSTESYKQSGLEELKLFIEKLHPLNDRKT
jgi:site-specific recombinase XerD